MSPFPSRSSFSPSSTWDSDEITLKNELKLVDDSYYRVYDDNDYETWRERMLSIIENQTKIISNDFQTDSIDNKTYNSASASSGAQDAIASEESTVNEINPIKPVFLDLTNETIYKGIEPKPPNIENYNLNVSWGMKYLLGEIDQKCEDSGEKTRFKSLLLDSKPGRSKWNNSNRIGQDELYQGLDKVLIDLKSYTPYSIPFLAKVSKKDVPDYYNVIKRPMDLGTMSKKLKSQEYISKQQFLDDLNLIFSNCFMYNTAEDSIYRQHIQMLRDKWTYLLKSVPDIVIGKYVPDSADKHQSNVQLISSHKGGLGPQNQSQSHLNQVLSSKTIVLASEPLDDLDDLLNAHLESLSDTESCPSPKKQRKGSTLNTCDSGLEPKFKYFNGLSDDFKKRCDKLMIKYASDCKSVWGIGKRANVRVEGTEKNELSTDSSSFVFPEFVYFFNTVPDTHLIKSTASGTNYSSTPVNTMNRFHDNFRILQGIRELRKHMLEGCRADPPNQDHLKTPSKYFNRFGDVIQGNVIENSWQAKCIVRKIITLYLAQAGFELISNSALYAFYELLEWNFRKIFDTFKLLTEQFQEEKDSADILRLCLLQLDIKHLSDLEVVMDETAYAKGRLEQLLNLMKGKVHEYQANIRGDPSIIKEESVDNDSGNEEDNDDEGDEEEDETPNEEEEQTVDDDNVDGDEDDNEDEDEMGRDEQEEEGEEEDDEDEDDEVNETEDED